MPARWVTPRDQLADVDPVAAAAQQPATVVTQNPHTGMESMFEWLSPRDAMQLAQAIQRLVKQEVAAALGEQAGANRAYAWTAPQPDVTPEAAPPPPYMIELLCRPVEFLASCITPPTVDTTFDVARSINQGATWVSMLTTAPVMAAGSRVAIGSVFKWEVPLTRTLTTPGDADAYPQQLRPGDMIRITMTGGTGIQSLSVQLRTQRIGEHRPAPIGEAPPP